MGAEDKDVEFDADDERVDGKLVDRIEEQACVFESVVFPSLIFPVSVPFSSFLERLSGRRFKTVTTPSPTSFYTPTD